MLSRLPFSISSLIFTFLIASPILSIASPVPDLVAHTPTPVQIAPRQVSKRMGKRMVAKVEPLQKKDYSSFLCPASAVACPVTGSNLEVTPESILELSTGLNSLADWFTVGFECVELATELNQCGGCLAFGEGQDCSLISNARATGCDKSTCVVYSCYDGYSVSTDRKTCIKKGAPPPTAATTVLGATEQVVIGERYSSL